MGVALVIGSCLSLPFGAAVAAQLFPVLGPWGVTSLRVAIAALLLVEDEAPVRAFAARALRLKGYEVHEAASAEEALRLLDGNLAVDIFVTDVVMPGLDGPSWVRKALRDRPGTKVIFMSGYTETTLSERTSPIPRALFLPKPFSLSELAASVERHLIDSGGIGPDAGRAATPPTRPAGAAALAARY